MTDKTLDREEVQEELLKKRWKKMRSSVQGSVDYMDVNHWMHLDNAIQQVECTIGMPNNKVSYQIAFDKLNKEVLDSYVSSDNPAEDIYEETYHLLKFFEQDDVSFTTYMSDKKKELKSKSTQ